MSKKLGLLAFVALAFLTSAGAQAPDWNRILTRIDEMGDFENNDFSAEITLSLIHI